MQKFTNVRSTAETVQPMEQTDSLVIINNNITEIHEAASEDDPASGFDGWEIGEQIIYEKDEYIALISQENAELGETVNSILTDIIPSLIVE